MAFNGSSVGRGSGLGKGYADRVPKFQDSNFNTMIKVGRDFRSKFIRQTNGDFHHFYLAKVETKSGEQLEFFSAPERFFLFTEIRPPPPRFHRDPLAPLLELKTAPLFGPLGIVDLVVSANSWDFCWESVAFV